MHPMILEAHTRIVSGFAEARDYAIVASYIDNLELTLRVVAKDKADTLINTMAQDAIECAVEDEVNS